MYENVNSIMIYDMRVYLCLTRKCKYGSKDRAYDIASHATIVIVHRMGSYNSKMSQGYLQIILKNIVSNELS